MTTSTSTKKKKAVAIWLLIGVFMIVVQIVLGGIVRLTDSGLSMTEWDPILGAIPPIGHAQWMEAFHRYQQIAQYKVVNSHYTLSDFKFIFFWEWLHRLWARSLAVIFAIPFIYFLIKKYFLKEMIWPLIILFLLGGLQGFIGWYMVESGLHSTGLLRVSHIRLSIHFVSALILLGYTLWFALKLLIPKKRRVASPKLKNYTLGILVLLTIQLFYGAFMAGMRAAFYAPTWPKINGRWIPANMLKNSWIDNAINVQFVHRGIAYILFVLICIGAYKIIKAAREAQSGLLKKGGIWIFVLVSIQVLLGVFTLLSVSHFRKGHFGQYEMLAESHQLNAILLLIALLFVYYMLRGKSPQKACG